MSYARMSTESGVYVFAHVNGSLCCCFCGLGQKSFYASSTREMVDHLSEHRAVGDLVPDDIEQDLWLDDAENFAPA